VAEDAVPVLRTPGGAAVIRNPVFPVVMLALALGPLGWMVWPHVTHLGRSVERRGRRTWALVAELREWWGERNPRPVAAFTDPAEDEPLWLTTVPMDQLRRQTLRLRRMLRKGRLRGGHITSLRYTWSELRRRQENAGKPNRSVMDVLSPDEQEFIDQMLQTKETGQ
jgi:hypothetical protein